jgi:NAD(P)-dependent dehydrogenase (short-subunit alcohol dehydrogenase family)/2-polyprenyl-6-methoxyphenol hydroxylase-like FAD-dependent oxidoreductase
MNGAVDTQVIVVGAGPVGLLLAGELRLGGAEVTVLEQLAEPTTESRASTVHARTMEIFDSRGLLSGFGELHSDVMGHFGGIPLDLTLPSPYPGQWKAPQVQTEAVLQQWAASLGADLRWGHRLRNLAVRPDCVEADVVGPAGPMRLRGLYLVGCDGEQSTVRRLTGVDFPGEDAGRELIRADVDGIEIPNRRFQRLPRGLAIAARRADGVTRVMAHEFGRAARKRTGPPDFEEIRDVWRRVTGEDVGGGTPLWLNAFGDASRQVTRYRQGRVLLAGDAAHRQLPVGGQALNLGLQDAANLGWKLALEVAGKAPAELLDSYHGERHEVGARVLGNIKAQAMLLLGGPEVEAVRAVVAELMGYERVRRRLAGMISGLAFRYTAGPGDHPWVGARVPPTEYVTETGPTSTAELLRPGRGLLLDLTGRPGGHTELNRTAALWGDRVDTVRPWPLDDDRHGGADALLVRPDGHVAWARARDAEDSAMAGLTEALERCFGRPARSAATPIRLSGTPVHNFGTAVTSSEWSDDMNRFEGKTALVTGASRGIGREIAMRLAREGALVAVHCSTAREAAEDVVASIQKDGGRAFSVQAEFGVPGDVHELFLDLERGLKEHTGSVELNILVNNAGVMGGVAPEDTTSEKFDRLFAVNAKAPFFIIQRALQNLTAGGRVINISSGLTRVANPDEIAYAMTKGAVEQLALHFARFLAPRGITINSVAPGITRNGSAVFDIPEAVEQMAQLSAFGRVGEPGDVADVVAFIASDEARWVTGAFIDASGGTLLG